MRIDQGAWGGTIPRVAPQLLPKNAAQDATNARLQSGDIEAWRQYSVEHSLATPAPVKTIYLLKDKWLSWGSDVAVARGPVPGDKTFRVILTGPGVYDNPQLTYYSLATTGPEPFPVATRILGVAAPNTQPLDIVYVGASGIDPGPVTSYVYTYVNDLGQESAPSPVAMYQANIAPATIPIPAPSGQGDYNRIDFIAIESGLDAYHISKIRLYRAATGNTGTAYRFVKEILYFGSLITFNDDRGDFELGEVLPSSNWDLPPSDLQGVISLPNGVMAGFFDNVLCLSAQNFPHAWPVEYQLTTDTDIVGLGHIDTTIVVFTESYPYLAIGVDPSAYTMTKLETQQAGTSRRSITSILNVGVIGATPDGLLAILGNGQPQNMTAQYFTRNQWQNLDPTSILGAAYNDVYFFSYNNGAGNKGAYALDTKPDGFGLIPLSCHFTAAYTDPISDQLYLVLDQVSEPVEPLLPIAVTTPGGANAHTIVKFDSPTGIGSVRYLYRSRLNILSRPVAFIPCQVQAADYTNLVLRIYGDGALMYSVQVLNDKVFTMPANDDYQRFEYELVGTSRVRSIQFGEIIEDLLV